MGVFDLSIEGGMVVTARGRAPLNVYVEHGRVAAVTPERHAAAERVDAAGLLVLPGMVDVHVHLMDPFDPSRETFPDGTAAAAVAGVTTLIEHTHGAPVRTPNDLAEKRARLEGASHVDYGFGAHAWPGEADQAEAVWAAGAAFIKLFTCTTHGVPGFDAASQLEVFERAAACGAICLVHCEDESLTAAAERRLRTTGRTDGAVIGEWRSREAELVATATTALLAGRSGARVVVAHVSHRGSLEPVVRARAAGADVLAECAPQYLSLLESEIIEELGFRKFTPPARARSAADLDRMWAALAEGTIHYIATDHAPATAAQKRDGSIWDVPFGLPGIDTTLPVLLDGARQGRLSYERVVEVYAERPAALYRLHGKGRLEPGFDADLTLVDPALCWTVANEDILSKAGWSPLAGRTLTGRSVRTYLRGQLVAAEGRPVGDPGAGRFVSGPGSIS